MFPSFQHRLLLDPLMNFSEYSDISESRVHTHLFPLFMVSKPTPSAKNTAVHFWYRVLLCWIYPKKYNCILHSSWDPPALKLEKKNEERRKEWWGQRWRERGGKFYLKNLAQVIVGKSEICRAGQQARDPRKSWCCCLEFKIHRTQQQAGNSGRIFMMQFRDIILCYLGNLSLCS